MKDLAVLLENKPGALAEMGEILGKAGISLEGGGVFVHNNLGVAHFLVDNAEKGSHVLLANGITVLGTSEVLIQKLNQGVPGQLGKICRIMQQAGVNILTQYSDHNNQLILIVDNFERGKLVSLEWNKGLYNSIL